MMHTSQFGGVMKKTLSYLAMAACSFWGTPTQALEMGQVAPEFDLVDQDDEHHSLREHLGRYVLLFFYPRDFTPHCTCEVKAFNEVCAELKKHDVVVYGISSDSVKSHKKFHQVVDLHYNLLSDVSRSVIDKYNASGFFGTKRISYLIGPDGKIFKRYDSVSPKNHALEVLRDIST